MHKVPVQIEIAFFFVPRRKLSRFLIGLAFLVIRKLNKFLLQLLFWKLFKFQLTFFDIWNEIPGLKRTFSLALFIFSQEADRASVLSLLRLHFFRVQLYILYNFRDNFPIIRVIYRAWARVFSKESLGIKFVRSCDGIEGLRVVWLFEASRVWQDLSLVEAAQFRQSDFKTAGSSGLWGKRCEISAYLSNRHHPKKICLRRMNQLLAFGSIND